MKRVFRTGRYANVTATVALVVALGGTSYAAVTLPNNSVGSSQLKRSAVANSDIRANAVTGGKVRKDTLTGDDVNESKLGTVPRAAVAGAANSATSATNAANAINAVNATNADKATTATNATNATNADKVGGQTIVKINYRANTGATATTIFDSGGLQITSSCIGGNTTLDATTTKQDSSIYSFVGGDGSPPAIDPAESDLEGGLFDTGVTFDLLAGGSANVGIVHFEYDALDGTIATGTIATDESGSVNNCLATGHVIVG